LLSVSSSQAVRAYAKNIANFIIHHAGGTYPTKDGCMKPEFLAVVKRDKADDHVIEAITNETLN